jgi:hypothetical protein
MLDRLPASIAVLHVRMDETLMRRYNGCGDNLFILSPHAGPPCIAASLSFFNKAAAQLSLKAGFEVFAVLPSFLIFVKSQE